MHLTREEQYRHIIELFRSGVDAADPFLAVKNCLDFHGDRLHIRLDLQDTSKQRTGNWTRIHLLSFGKAACKMATAARQRIPKDRLAGDGIAVTTYDNIYAIEETEVIGAGHPLPDSAGLRAAGIVAARAASAQKSELVLVLLSGGGSALLPLPVTGISLADKIATTDQLLACGATINQINCVRKHLSQLKGGGLAKAAAPADLHALVLSDVLGDDISAIASGPTVPDDTRFEDAISILEQYRIWLQVPVDVRNHLREGAQGLQEETPKSGADCFKTATYTLIGSNTISIDAVTRACSEQGYQALVYSTNLCGEARTAAERLVMHAKSIQSCLERPTALIAGGETTVRLFGERVGPGKGGRNQEMALAFALAAEKLELSGEWIFLSGGTDGKDGPTDAAGGVVSPETLRNIRAAGFDPTTHLQRHDAYPALKVANSLLMTGATGTNVADLQILLMYPS